MRKIISALIVVVIILGNMALIRGQEIDRAPIFFIAPASETLFIGSTFEVSIFLDTRHMSVRSFILNLKFSPDKLTIIKPSSGASFVSVWSEAPTYSNSEGVATFNGEVSHGIVTDSGLVTTITFRTKTTGQAVVEILPSSKIITSDDREMTITPGVSRGIYRINLKPAEGVKIFSESHPLEDKWYNNNNLSISWMKEQTMTDFSFVLDNQPFTVPDNTTDSQQTTISRENLTDGVWYFHVKAKKNGVWGQTTHFSIHIDTAPPLSFQPQLEFLTASIIFRALIRFQASDLLSGIDHYEVGVIDKEKSPLTSPVFIQAESPYQIPQIISKKLRIVIKALDRAGNVRDESVDVNIPFVSYLFLQNNLTLLLTMGIVSFLLLILIHYLFGHRILARLKTILRLMKKEDENSMDGDNSEKHDF